MHAAVPAIEIAYHRNALGVRRPDAETHALHALACLRQGTEHSPGGVIAAFRIQVQPLLVTARRVGPAVCDFPDVAVRAQSQAPVRRHVVRHPLEHARRMHAAHRLVPGRRGDEGFRRVRLQRADHPTRFGPVASQQGERVVFPPLDESADSCVRHFDDSLVHVPGFRSGTSGLTRGPDVRLQSNCVITP